MTSAIVQRRDYLVGQRRLIIARAVAGSVAGIIPVPFLDDWARAAVLGGGYRRIAASHGVDLDEQAVTNLVHGKSPPSKVADLAVSGIAYRIASRAAKRMMLALAAVGRARSAAKTFVTMTLFDHYCTKLHTGFALDGATALALREEIDRAIVQTPGALGFHPFRKGLASAARATLKAPLELADLATRGAVRRLLAKKSTSDVTDAEAVDSLDHAIETELANKTGFLSRTVAAVEVQLSADANPFLDQVIETFDRNWRAFMAAKR